MTAIDRSGCPAPRHGTAPAYTDVACRCADAREAWRLYNKRRREGRHVPAFVPSIGSARRLQALVAIGYNWADLARESGNHVKTVRDVGYWRRDRIHVDTAAWVRELYGRLSDTPGKSAYALTVARRHGYLPPIWWDDNIDDPDADPLGEAQEAESAVIDEVAVDRALRGWDVELTKAEKHAAVLEGRRRGHALTEVAIVLRMNYNAAKKLAAKPLPAMAA